MTTFRHAIVNLAKRPDGVVTTELCALIDRSSETVRSHLRKLEATKRLFRAKKKGLKVRFFASVSDRDDWLQAPLTGVANKDLARPHKPRLVDVHEHIRSRARKPGMRPIPLPGSEGQLPPVIIHSPKIPFSELVADMNGVEVNHCSAPKAYGKFWFDPDIEYEGAGFRKAGPGIDATTGRPWA